MRPAADYVNSQGVLHGGVIASIADEAAWHAMLHAYQGQRNATTSELKVNYLRPIAMSKVIARAYALRAGKTLFVSRVDMFRRREAPGRGRDRDLHAASQLQVSARRITPP